MADEAAVSVQGLLSASLKNLERSPSGRRIRIVRQIDPTTPPLRVDAGALKEVLDTLLAEAAAGTEEGGRVRVCLKHNATAVMVSIKDQGAGLTPEAWEKRLEDAGRSRAAGAPLTLGDCRKAVVSAGGNFFANSRPGKGITYYVTFPAPRP